MPSDSSAPGAANGKTKFPVVLVEGQVRPVNSHYERVERHYEFLGASPDSTQKMVDLLKYWIVPENGRLFAYRREDVVGESFLWEG